MPERTVPRDTRAQLIDPRKRYQVRHKAMGLCTLCPRPLAEGSTAYCDWHREKNRQRKRRLRGRILCRKCRKPLAEAQRRPGARYHRRCFRAVMDERKSRYRQLHASAARAYQLRNAAQGLCTHCPRRVVRGKRVCRRHLHYRQERYRRLKAGSKARSASS